MGTTMTHSLAAVLMLGVASACSDYGAVAPEGSTLSLAAASDSLGTGQDSTLVAASIFLESGELIGYEAEVTFQTSLGGLCALRKGIAECAVDSVHGLPAITVDTKDGVAIAVLKGVVPGGSATVQASSGGARDSTVVTFGP